MVDFYGRPGLEAHAFSLFCGFGAPLLKLVGGNTVKGAWVHLKNNGSGTGKSTAQMVANSIFGHPSDLLMKKADTPNSKMHMLGMLNSLVFTVDEITNESSEALSEMAYGITQGRGKHRMDGQSNRLRVNHTTWSTFTLSSGNASVVDMLMQLKSTADGEMRRVLELSVSKYLGATKAEIDAVFSKLDSNYGVAGPIYVEYIMANREKVVDMVLRMQAKVDRELELDQSDRHYSLLLCCTFTGALIAERLGLHSIPIKPVYEYIKGEVQMNQAVNRLAVGDPYTVALETLGAFVNDNVNNALVAPYTPPGGVPERPAIAPKGALRMRYDPDNKELAISAVELRKYLTARQVDVKEAVGLLAARGIVKHNGEARPTRLGAGAVGGLNGISLRCYILDGDAIGIDREQFVSDD